MSRVSRRGFIGGALAGLVLPQFHSLAKASVGARGVPTRVVYVGMGYGVSPQGWFPDGENGSELQLPELLQPMEKHKDDISILQNLSLLGGPPSTSPAHSSSLFYLNDAHALNPKATRRQSMISCDQVAAQIVGHETPYPSLVLTGAGKSSQAGGHGYGLRSISFDGNGRNIPGVPGAFGLYRLMFGNRTVKLGSTGGGGNELKAQFAQKRSVLDFLVKDIKSLNTKLSSGDKDVLDQYTSSVREVELNISRSIKAASKKTPLPKISPPNEGLAGIDDVKLTYELMAIALQANFTRVITYMHPVSSILKSIGAKVDAHAMSHYKGQPAIDAHRKRDLVNMELLAHFFDRLKGIRQPDGKSLFHHSMISFGGGLRHKHTRGNLPVLFAGYGGGGIKQGLNVVSQKNKTPLTNLWFSQLRQLNPKIESYNNSKNTISEVFTK